MLHPIVAQMRPSPEQGPAIRERGRDIAVTAGAGAGKTRTLVARYLSLLADGRARDQPLPGQVRGLLLRGVVAITFTRKAAREMRNRIREEVRRYLERTDLSPAERDRWRALYTGLDAARIGTIHSLCTEILRAHPAEARVDPRFEVLEEGQANILRRRAVDEALAWAADDREAVGLFALLGEWELRRTLDALLGQRLEVEGVFDSLDELPWQGWEAALLPRLRAFVDDGRVGFAFRQLLALRVDGTLDRAEASGDRLAAPLRRLLALWDEIVAARQAEDWGSVSVRLAPLRREMKQVGRRENWEPADSKSLIRELQVAYDDALAAWVGNGISLDQDRQLAEAMPALRRSFERALAFYRRMKHERQALDFDDLEGGALALLQENVSVRRRWQAEVEAILVDEFQDTNGRQRDLVALLNGDGGKLFVVGDAKQSIYRFRGADVTVFRAERGRIERAGGAVFALETSYRAHRDLIQGLNDLLRPVLGKAADPDRPWAEPFAPLRHYRQEPGPGFSPPYIELHLTVGTKGAGALDRAADALVGRIVELMEIGVQVKVGAGLASAHIGAGLVSAQIGVGVEQGQHRPLDYGDVAILCRASSSFSAYEDALERAGVPFLTVAGRGFYGRPEVRDLLNGLQALADPTDDLALAGLLRSPAFALSDAALYDLCQARGRDGGSTSLWDVLRGIDGGLSGEDRARAGRATQTIADLHGGVGRMPVADLLKAFLDATDYRAALIQAGQSRAARNVAKLLADAHTSGIVGVGEFLEYVGSLRDSGTREGE
ncbi:MAG: UvrD-helicase domain-containing protein, partial [Anaerolineae bacterium]